MSRTHVFNPDDALRTPEGRVFTAERNAAAWEHIYSELEAIMAAPNAEMCLYVVMGVQGSGKTTWVKEHRESLGAAAVILDAALPARAHRARALAIAARYDCRTVGVWIRVPLDQAIAQNASRPADEVVPESALRSVFNALEPPSRDEGFDRVVIVDPATA